jgi:hypothetical protein
MIEIPTTLICDICGKKEGSIISYSPNDLTKYLHLNIFTSCLHSPWCIQTQYYDLNYNCKDILVCSNACAEQNTIHNNQILSSVL